MPDEVHDDANTAAIQAYYRRDEERDRLAAGEGLLEFVRTVELLSRALPTPPALVADIGGGPGRYVDWLVDRGYEVVHRDLVPGHIDQIRYRHRTALVDAAVGDARQLDLDDSSVDAILLLGPLYHLPVVDDRLAALAEAGRVVKPGGPVFAAAISRSSLRFEALVRKQLHLDEPTMVDMVTRAEETGVMDQVADDSFSGYAHTPDQLAREVTGSGLVCDTVVPVEGPAFMLPDLDDRLADTKLRRELLDDLAVLETAPDLAGFALHLLAIAHRRRGL